MEVHHFLTLYLTSPTVVTVDAVQGDGVRVIAARLMEGAEPWQVPEGVSAGISYELPGKQPGYYDQLSDGRPACMISGDLVTAAIDSSLTAAAGNVKLSIVLRDGAGGQVATFPLVVRVAKRPGRIGAEEMAPPSAYEGKLLMGGRAGETVPVDVGLGLRLERTADGATLSAEGGGAGTPGGSCECSAPYVASDEPPEDVGALWIDTSESDEAVALGATVVETADGVEIYATDELGTTRATVRHGKDGAPGAKGEQGDPGERYEPSPDDLQQIARMAAELVEVPEGGGIAISGARPGQLARITDVDENGVPTAWEPVSVPGQELLLLENTIEIPQDTPVSELEWALPNAARGCDAFFIELYGSKPTNAPASSVKMQVNMCGNDLYGGSTSNGAVRNNNQNWIQIHCDFVKRLIVNLTYNNPPEYNSNISMSAWTLTKVLSVENRTNVLSVKLSEAYAGTISATVRGYTGWEVSGNV